MHLPVPAARNWSEAKVIEPIPVRTACFPLLFLRCYLRQILFLSFGVYFYYARYFAKDYLVWTVILHSYLHGRASAE